MKIRIFVLLVAVASFAFSISAQVTPTNLNVPGLKSEVTVRRDARGIPYIEAKNDADLYFAQGYITASDRMWQMDLMRRLARGETAELFGQQALEGDKRWRRFGFAALTTTASQNLTGEARVAMEAYASGVNAYIATLTDTTMPPEFKILQFKPRPWTPADSLVIGAVLADALSNTWQTDLLRLQLSGMPKEKFADLANPVTPNDVVLYGKDTKPAAVAAAVGTQPVSSSILASAQKDEQHRKESLEMVGLYADGLAASNNWVISGTRTADGKAMLANDPHLAPSAPGVWYLASIQSPSVHAAGVSIPGIPAIIIGHNDNIAWGMTNTGPDVQDIYEEKLSAIDPGGVYCFQTPSGCQQPIVRDEIILVRKNLMAVGSTATPLRVEASRNGPIILEDGGKKYSLKWTMLDPKNLQLETFFKLNRAANWQDFQAALKNYGGATQNFVYADVKGNIGWYAAGQVPIRRKGDGSLPYDGATADGDWTGMIPFEELPHLYNPPAGFIVTANQRIAGTDYKYPQMTRTYTSWRARRIKDQLEANTKITMDQVRDVQYDTFDIPLSNFAKEIVKLGAASADTLGVLKSWDGRLTADSRGSLLANGIRACVAGKMADDNKPAPPGYISARIIDWAVREQTPRWLPSGFANYTELLKSCDASTRTSFADPNRYGPDPTKWVWGQIFKSRFPHQLAAAPLIGAQFATPLVPLDGSNASESPNVGSNVSMRLIASPGNWDATRHVIPLGESGNPQSSHFKDQFDAWRTGTPMIFPFTKAAVEKASVEMVRLVPR